MNIKEKNYLKRDKKEEMHMLLFQGCVISEIGLVHINNEDNYVLGNYINNNAEEHSEISVLESVKKGDWKIAGVFDGMGGGEKGELAAQETAKIFVSAFKALQGIHSKAEVDLSVRKAFLEANNTIVMLQKRCNVLGTTGTVLCTNGEIFKIYHLGDSRAYLLRDKELLQLTKDQTLAQLKIDARLYGEDHSQIEADKHKLTEYIGRDRTLEHITPMETSWISMKKEDKILLCSDGLFNACNAEQIRESLIGDMDEKEQIRELVERAVLSGGKDNITCALVNFKEFK